MLAPVGEYAMQMVADHQTHSLPPKDGAPQPTGGEEQKPKDLSGPVVWTQNKEEINATEDATRRERGKDIEDAGGKSDKL